MLVHEHFNSVAEAMHYAANTSVPNTERFVYESQDSVGLVYYVDNQYGTFKNDTFLMKYRNGKIVLAITKR